VVSVQHDVHIIAGVHNSQIVLAIKFFMVTPYICKGRDSSVGIATRYGLDGPGIESRWERDFSAPVQTGPGAHPASCTGSLLGGKAAGGVVLTTHPLSKSRGHERVELYLYSPSGPSWPVIGRTFTFTLPYICGSSVWNLLHVTFLAPRIQLWLPVVPAHGMKAFGGGQQ
jgi:hypothetical protein